MAPPPPHPPSFKEGFYLQVRINNMVDDHSLVYHPSSSGLTTRIHFLIFLCTPLGLSLSRICAGLSLKPIYPTMVGKTFKFMVIRLVETACASQEIECRHVYPYLVLPPANLHPGSYYTPRTGKLLILPQAAFFRNN